MALKESKARLKLLAKEFQKVHGQREKERNACEAAKQEAEAERCRARGLSERVAHMEKRHEQLQQVLAG